MANLIHETSLSRDSRPQPTNQRPGNLIPSPRLRFFMTGFAPLFRGRMCIKEVDEQMLNVRNKNSSSTVCATRWVMGQRAAASATRCRVT